MKQTLHRLLSALLVLTMLCGMAPAVFADETPNPGGDTPPVVHNDTHTVTYTTNGNGTHHVKCTAEGCNFEEDQECSYGAWEHVEGTFTHKQTCTYCGYARTETCTQVYETKDGYHTLKCGVCAEVYSAPEACTDADGDNACDVCGESMPAAAEKEIVAFEQLALVEAPVGTKFEDLELPKTVTGFTAEREQVPCPVTWSASGYDKDKTGVYRLTGTVAVPEGYALAETVSGTVIAAVKISSGYSIELTPASRSVSVGSTLSITAGIKQNGAAVTNTTGLSIVWKVDQTALADITSSSSSYYYRDTVGILSAKACRSVSGTNVEVSATLMRGTEELAAANTTVKIVPAAAAVIKANASNGGVVFGENAFYYALGYYGIGLSSELEYVTFALPSSSTGVLYSDSSRYGSPLTSGNRCYFNARSAGVVDLDNVYFKVADRYTGSSVTLSYTAYNSDGNIIATGTIDVSLLTSTIRYHADPYGKVTFEEEDFRSVLRANYSGSTLSYVQFDMSSAVFGNSYAGSGKYGYVYVDSTLTTKLTESNDTAKFKYNYQNSDARYYYDLDDVTYVAGSASGVYSVLIPFTAYGTGYEAASGLVEIVVDGADAFTIGYTGTDFSAVTKEIAAAFRNATHVVFELPEEGTLYYNYNAINNYSHAVRANYAYYLNPTSRDEYDLDDVFFVPAAGQTKATIRFTVYNGRTKLDSSSVTFSVKGKTASSVFTDVTYANTGSWSADAVDFMNANGLLYGTGKNRFNPTGTMTRGDLVLILYRMAGQPSVSGVKNPFTDVKSSDYYYKAVLWAYANNVVNGTGRSTFSPKENVTREQLAAILYRYSGAPATSSRLTAFTDAGRVSSYAADAMKWAVGAGIITGNGNKLDPQGSATRAQVAAMLHRYLTK